ncbi:hypothetical protein HK101_008961 [Irineochytrium annulatum]|nr:hypothetical protein HK101_008961 [Irineochytrium annulatum]
MGISSRGCAGVVQCVGKEKDGVKAAVVLGYSTVGRGVAAMRRDVANMVRTPVKKRPSAAAEIAGTLSGAHAEWVPGVGAWKGIGREAALQTKGGPIVQIPMFSRDEDEGCDDEGDDESDRESDQATMRMGNDDARTRSRHNITVRPWRMKSTRPTGWWRAEEALIKEDAIGLTWPQEEVTDDGGTAGLVPITRLKEGDDTSEYMPMRKGLSLRSFGAERWDVVVEELARMILPEKSLMTKDEVDMAGFKRGTKVTLLRPSIQRMWVLRSGAGRKEGQEEGLLKKVEVCMARHQMVVGGGISKAERTEDAGSHVGDGVVVSMVDVEEAAGGEVMTGSAGFDEVAEVRAAGVLRMAVKDEVVEEAFGAALEFRHVWSFEDESESGSPAVKAEIGEVMLVASTVDVLPHGDADVHKSEPRSEVSIMVVDTEDRSVDAIDADDNSDTLSWIIDLSGDNDDCDDREPPTVTAAVSMQIDNEVAVVHETQLPPSVLVNVPIVTGVVVPAEPKPALTGVLMNVQDKAKVPTCRARSLHEAVRRHAKVYRGVPEDFRLTLTLGRSYEKIGDAIMRGITKSAGGIGGAVRNRGPPPQRRPKTDQGAAVLGSAPE